MLPHGMLVILLKNEGADELGDRGIDEEDADDTGESIGFDVGRFERDGRGESKPSSAQSAHR